MGLPVQIQPEAHPEVEYLEPSQCAVDELRTFNEYSTSLSNVMTENLINVVRDCRDGHALASYATSVRRKTKIFMPTSISETIKAVSSAGTETASRAARSIVSEQG